MFQIKRALISCTDKTGIADLALFLVQRGVEIISTGGTSSVLKEAGVPVTDVASYTGFPEMLDGRLKTLHPRLHGGILGKRANPEHVQQMALHNINPIDLVVVNLYAFEKTVATPGCTLEDAIENIDIGGPTLLRAAAKNHESVAVVVDPADYQRVMTELAASNTLSTEFRFALAAKVFAQTARYDAAISAYLNKQGNPKGAAAGETLFPHHLSVSLSKVADLRYGENPHQQAALYRQEGAGLGLLAAEQLQGKELSFNNYLDMEAARLCVQEFDEPACVIVKHLNPCGAALAGNLADAFVRARATDPVSSFGGIVAVNRVVDRELAVLMSETFFEVVVAPDYEPGALEVFGKKKNLRVMRLPVSAANDRIHDFRCVAGGMLVQQPDSVFTDVTACTAPSKRAPTATELEDLDFAWRVVKHVRSNAIVFARAGQLLGVGAGQMSRVDAVKMAAIKALETFKEPDILHGAVMASDAFFPFRDGVDLAAGHGIGAIIQPGGSVRDDEVIAACNEKGLAMVFTGERHFRH